MENVRITDAMRLHLNDHCGTVITATHVIMQHEGEVITFPMDADLAKRLKLVEPGGDAGGDEAMVKGTHWACGSLAMIALSTVNHFPPDSPFEKKAGEIMARNLPIAVLHALLSGGGNGVLISVEVRRRRVWYNPFTWF